MNNSKNWTTASFISRHLIACIVSILFPILIVVVAYFVLLFIAIITNSGLGGPLALPGGVIIAFALSLFYSLILLFPSTALAELATNSLGKWKHLIQIPLSFLLLALLAGITSAIGHALVPGNVTLVQWIITSGILTLVLAIPLGVYYWTMKFSHLVTEALKTFGRWFKSALVQDQ